METKRDNSLYLTGCVLAFGMAFIFAVFELESALFESFAMGFWFAIFLLCTSLASWFSVGIMSLGALMTIAQRLAEIIELLQNG